MLSTPASICFRLGNELAVPEPAGGTDGDEHPAIEAAARAEQTCENCLLLIT
jgi:hypothetical protein